MATRKVPILCANCYIPIAGTPVMVDGEAYCCRGCAAGGPCICSYSNEETPPSPGETKASIVVSKEEVLKALETEGPAAQDLGGLREELRTSLSQFATYLLQGLQEAKGEELGPALERAAQALKETAARVSGVPGERPLHAAITLVVSPLPDPYIAHEFGTLVEKLPGVSEVALWQFQEGTAQFKLRDTSPERLVCSLVRMPHFRPKAVRVGPDQVELTLAPETMREGAPAELLPEVRPEVIKEMLQQVARPEVMERREDIRGEGYEIGVDVFFNARHFVTLNGHQGPIHPHSWRVRALVCGEAHPIQGVLVGFADVRRVVQQEVAKYDNTLLNRLPPFAERQPTSENLVAILFKDINASLKGLPIRLKSLDLWETPTNLVTYYGEKGHED